MKIFLCSTSFDLEDLRALAVQRFGAKHEFIHFEDAAFASRRGLHSHDQCIEAVKQADVVVCIIDRRYGGRYGGTQPTNFPEISFKVGKKKSPVVVPTADLSISWCELIAAYRDEKYVITFARKRTMDEKSTRRKNQDVPDFKPAHVDDVRVFDLLDWITHRPKDNWIIPFDNAVDFLKKLEKWLAVADASLVPPVAPKARGRKPITVIVEGQTDASIVKSIAGTLALNRPISLVVAEGKRPLLGNLKIYARAFKDAAGIIVLAVLPAGLFSSLYLRLSRVRMRYHAPYVWSTKCFHEYAHSFSYHSSYWPSPVRACSSAAAASDSACTQKYLSSSQTLPSARSRRPCRRDSSSHACASAVSNRCWRWARASSSRPRSSSSGSRISSSLAHSVWWPGWKPQGRNRCWDRRGCSPSRRPVHVVVLPHQAVGLAAWRRRHVSASASARSQIARLVAGLIRGQHRFAHVHVGVLAAVVAEVPCSSASSR